MSETGRFRFVGVAFWCLAVAICLTLAHASSMSREAAGALGFLTAIFVIPFIVAAVVNDEKRARTLLILLLTSGAVNGLVALLDARFGTTLGPDRLSWNEFEPTARSRAVGLTGHPNVLGYVAAVTVPIVPAMVMASAPRAKLAVSGLGALVVLGLALSGSRGGALGALAGLLFVASRSARVVGDGRLRRRILVLIALCPIGLALAPGSSLADRLLGGADATASDERRIAGLSSAIEAVRTSFPVGTGFAQIYTVHSGVLAILAAGGLLALIGAAVWTIGMWQVMGLAGRSSAREIRILAVGCQASAVGALVFLATSPIIYHRYALVPVAVALGLVSVSSSTSPAPGARSVRAAFVLARAT